MSLTRKIAGNTILRVAARLIGNVFGVIVVALLTRYLGQEGFGNYTTILAYLFFFGALADLGLYMLTINEINKIDLDRSRFYSAVYSLRLYSGVVLLLLAVGLVWVFPYPSIVKQGVMIVALSIFFGLLDQIQVAVYQAELNVVRVAVGELLGKVVLIAGVFIGIWLQVGLLTILWVLVLAQGLQWFISLTGLFKRIKFRLNLDRKYWRQIIRRTWPIALSQLFVLIYFKMDTIFISLLRPPATAQIEVGIYGAPYKILEVLIALIPIFMGLVSPVLSRVWSAGLKEKFRDMYQKIFDAFSIIVWPLVVGGVVLARPLMDLIAPGFESSDKILQILMVAIGVIFFAHLPTYIIVTLGQQRSMLKAYALAAALATVLYVVFIPIYSIWAAAWITVLVESMVLVMAWRRIKKVAQINIKYNIFSKAIFASLVMAGILWGLKDWNIFILLVLGAMSYLVVMVAVKGITKKMIEKILSREVI